MKEKFLMCFSDNKVHCYTVILLYCYTVIVLYFGTRYDVCECNSVRVMTISLFFEFYFVGFASLLQFMCQGVCVYGNLNELNEKFYIHFLM